MKKIGCILLGLMLVLTVTVGAKAAEPEVAGKSAVVVDVDTGTVLYAHNEHEPLAPASVTKVMTMLLIMEAVDSGALGWQDTVTASETAAAKGGSQVYLKVGETMTVEEMVKSIAVSSANDCACAMAEHLAGSEAAFVERMNARAAELGMEDTHFVNCTGLDDSPEAENHRTSAYDIALMSRELLKNHPDIERFTTIWMDSVRNGAFGLTNTNKLVRFYPGATGLKTGFTRGAGYCLSASARRDGLGLIAVVMGAETSQDRFDACRNLLDRGFAGYARYCPETTEGEVAVELGKADSVRVVPARDPAMLVEKSQLGQISARPELAESVPAPVSRGQALGELVIRCGDRELARIPLVAETAVERLNFADLFLAQLSKVAMAG